MIFILLIFILTSCVSKNDYAEVEAERDNLIKENKLLAY